MLTAHRKTATVTNALVAADLNLAADVGCHLTTEVTFDLEVAFKEVAELDELLVTKVTDASVGVDARRGQCLLRAGTTHAENVGKCDLDALFAWEVDTNKTCHLVRSPDHCGGLKHHHSRAVTAPSAETSKVPGLRAGGDILCWNLYRGSAHRGRVLLSCCYVAF